MDGHTLRTLVTAVEVGVTHATAPEATANDKQALARAWGSLVQHLALGPAPETRACPRCSREIMCAATICGYCWSRLVPSVGVGGGE
ncbi:MAG TPA: hypothetical protein VGI39_19175 [Polyangiaceae bacterium]